MHESEIDAAVAVLRDGGIVLHATEGVWGFACDPQDKTAVTRILQIKGRPIDKGLIVIGSEPEAFALELAALTDEQRRDVLSTWPGRHTWVLPNGQFPRMGHGRPANSGLPGTGPRTGTNAGRAFRRGPDIDVCQSIGRGANRDGSRCAGAVRQRGRFRVVGRSGRCRGGKRYPRPRRQRAQDGLMDDYLVVGNPIEHSLSPQIHSAFAAATGEPIHYDKALVPLDGFAAFVDDFVGRGGKGLNVTLPFKLDAYAYVDECDATASTAQAVNTIAVGNAGDPGLQHGWHWTSH